MIDIEGRGVAAGRAFQANSVAIRLVAAGMSADPVPSAIADVERTLAARADEFHHALPLPTWTDREEAAMSASEKVQRARDEYMGERLVAISLGLRDWIGYVVEIGLPLSVREHVRDDGVAVRPGHDLRYEVAEAPSRR